MRLKKAEKEIVGIIVPACLKYVPYIQNYIDILRKKGTDFRVLSWNKMGLEESGVDFAYDLKARDEDRKGMFFGYIRFICACKKYIRACGINKLIVLTAAPAFFMGVPYLKKFSGNYILDIRDDSPFIRVFPGVFRKICSMAKSVVVSSPNFSPWTNRDTVLCHNADMKQIEKNWELQTKQSYAEPITIAFAGMMIEGPINIEVLRRCKGDGRFAFYFIGRPNAQKEAIERYVRDADMKNVIFEGTYNKDDIVDIYRQKADLVNILREKSEVNKNALPNKLYDAVISGVPIVVFEHNEAVAKYVAQYHLGILLREEDMDLVNDAVYEKMTTFDYSAYETGRRAFLNQVREDMTQFADMVALFANVSA